METSTLPRDPPCSALCRRVPRRQQRRGWQQQKQHKIQVACNSASQRPFPDPLCRPPRAPLLQDPTTPAKLYNHDNEYLHYEDDWWVVGQQSRTSALCMHVETWGWLWGCQKVCGWRLVREQMRRAINPLL